MAKEVEVIEPDKKTLKEIEIKKIIEKEGFKDALISSYDLNDTSFDSILEDLDTYGFLSEKKVIIVSNIDLFDIEKNKDYYEHLNKYFDNPDPDKLLIFTTNNINHTNKLYKDLVKKCVEVKEEISSKAFIKKCFEGYDIDQNTINLLDEYSLGDFTKINSEAQKLRSYKIDSKKIVKEDIIEMVSKKLGDTRELTFSFSSSIGLRDREDALKNYKGSTLYSNNSLYFFKASSLSLIPILLEKAKVSSLGSPNFLETISIISSFTIFLESIL